MGKKKELTPNLQEHEVVVSGSMFYRFIKRTLDIVVSLTMMLLLSWLMIILLLIKFFEDFHNPIYVSKRVGKNGKEFNFFKIRSMEPDAEKKKKDLIKEGLNETDGPAFKMKDDPRITKFGKFLRKTSLDELPQLMDVFLGKMSFIGPRPPLPEEVEKYTEYQKHRLDVKGGLVCLWQISKNRHQISFDEWVALDILYIENRSFGLDMKIFFKAIWFVLTDRTGE